MVNMQGENQQVFTPQSTQIYKLIGDLMEIVRQRYSNAPKSTRNLTMTYLWRTLAEMTGDYCMAFTSRDYTKKIEYLDRLRNKYYEAESMILDLVKDKVISIGFAGEIAKTKLTPLIKQINGLSKQYEQNRK